MKQTGGNVKVCGKCSHRGNVSNEERRRIASRLDRKHKWHAYCPMVGSFVLKKQNAEYCSCYTEVQHG